MSVPRSILLFLLCAVCGVAHVHAQMAAQFYWNPADRADTVIDFGVTPVGRPIQRSFTIRNTGSVPLVIPVTDPRADPYYSIVNVPEIPPQAPPKEEFEGVEPLPYSIPVGEERSFGILFKAVAGNPTLPPDVATEALLHLRAVDPANTLGPSVNWTFRLRALKTTRILATNRPIVRFDSVYVRPVPSAPTERYAIANVTTQTIDATVRPLVPLSPVIGTSEFTIVPTATNVQFTSQSVLDWVVTYAPRDRGADSAQFIVAFQPSDSAPKDSVVSMFHGVGVEQELVIASATGTQTVTSTETTVDFGQVLADGKGMTATIIFKNRGNTRIGIDGESREGTNRDTNVFVVQRKLADAGASILLGDTDTLVVHFVPTDAGPYEIAYVVHSDILRRHFRGTPDSVRDIRFVFRGFGLRPQVVVTPSTIDFGTVVLVQNCTSSQERTITIKNNGNVILRVDSIGIEPSSTTVIPNKNFFNIPVDQSTSLTLTFVPTVQGTSTGTVRLFTNALPPVIDVPFVASVVRPDTIVVHVPTTSAARPGHTVRVPFVVQGDRAALTDRVSFTMSYDPSLLVYRSVFTAGGGAEGATIQRADEEPAGVLHMQLQTPANFKDRDTLLWMIFDTYLGVKSSTELALADENVAFGNAGCTSVLNVRATSGLFHLDSLCGLSYKTLVDQRVALVSDAVPNPSHGETTITVVTPREGELSVRVYDAFGRLVRVVATDQVGEGLHLYPVDTVGMPSGIYVVEAILGRARSTISLMVGS